MAQSKCAVVADESQDGKGLPDLMVVLFQFLLKPGP